MVASLSVRVYTSTNAATESGAQTGISFLSADSALTTLPDRQANPINVGSQSYEKWLKLKIDTAPANGVTNFQIWGDAAVMASSTLFFTANRITGVTPVATVSSIATSTFTSFSSSAKAVWDATSYTATSATTRYAVFQLAIDATAAPGTWLQETISYSYDET
jgi:hypothetical protein